jgi:hypothetical protein
MALLCKTWEAQQVIRPWHGELVFHSVDPAIYNSWNEGADNFKPAANTL